MRMCPLCVVGASLLVGAAGLIGVGTMVGVGERPAPLAADGYTVDGTHSFVNFRIKHNNVSYAYGRFNKISGSFQLDKDKPDTGAIDVSIDTKSIDTANSKRDDHLKTQQFFSVEEFPTATFKSKSFKKEGETLNCTGDLTIHGVTKSVTVPVEIVGTGEGKGGKIAGFECKFMVKRSDYGMTYMVGPLGDEVTILVSCEGGMK
jgi:polyisoprenoid-binding protein YceI